MTTLLQHYSKLHRIEQDIDEHKATKKQAAYLEERRVVIGEILDLTICAATPDCDRTRCLFSRVKDTLLDQLGDFEQYTQELIRAILDDFGEELRQLVLDIQSLVAL
jgi:hypothetical protein